MLESVVRCILFYTLYIKVYSKQIKVFLMNFCEKIAKKCDFCSFFNDFWRFFVEKGTFQGVKCLVVWRAQLFASF